MPYPGWSPKEIRILKAFIEANVLKEHGCWIWLGQSGAYGNLTFRRRSYSAHRLAHELWNGPVDGWVVRHTCDVKLCVNPKHLIIGTVQDNVRDAIERGLWKQIVVTDAGKAAQRAGVQRGKALGHYSDPERKSASMQKLWRDGKMRRVV